MGSVSLAPDEMAELEAQGQTVVPGVEARKLPREKAIRRKDDAYFTPKWCALIGVAILQKLLGGSTWFTGPRVLEPAAGDGALYRACKHTGFNWDWTLRDLNQHNCDLQEMIEVKDFLKGPPDYTHDAIITNPPFSLAQEFIERSLLTVDTTVMLLRLSFLGAQKRHHFLRRHTPDVHILSKRPSFTEDGGTDSAEYAWFAWHPKAEGRIFYPRIEGIK